MMRIENGNQRMQRKRGVLFLDINLYKFEFEYSRNNSLSMILTFRDFEKIAGRT